MKAVIEVGGKNGNSADLQGNCHLVVTFGTKSLTYLWFEPSWHVSNQSVVKYHVQIQMHPGRINSNAAIVG